MQINRATDYAVRVMIHLAALPRGGRANRESLAESTQVPAEFLGKVLQTLSRAGLVSSRRGSDGGYELAKPAHLISMLEVVEAMEGPLNLNECLTGENLCGRVWWCGAHDVWREAQAAMVHVLGSATIERLSQESMARLHRDSDLVRLQTESAPWT